PDPDRSAGRRGDTHAQPVDRHRRRRRHHRGRDRHRSLRGEETGPRRGRRNRPVTRLRGLIAPTCFLETTTERRGHCACTGVSALHRGFGRFPGARSGLGALPWFRLASSLPTPGCPGCPGFSRTSLLPRLLAHLTALALWSLHRGKSENQRSRLGSVTSNAGEPHNLNARTPAHTTATTTERRDNGVRGIFQAVCDSS